MLYKAVIMRGTILGIALLSTLAVVSDIAVASTITVTSLNDSGAGSLREAIAGAGIGDTIEFSLAGTIILTGGPLTIGQDLTIIGPTESSLIVNGNAGSEVFNITGGNVALSNLTITNGSRSAGGGILNAGALSITNSSIIANSSSNGEGGGILNVGTLTLVNSTISSNTAYAGAGIANRQGFLTTLVNSTITDNSATDHAGGIRNNNGTVNLTNTILAGNTAPTGPECTGPLTSQGHNLIGNDTGCSFTPLTGDLVGTTGDSIDPLLGPLQDNGGPTLTHALLFGSPAVDTADTGVAPETDQRGVARPQDSASDIGAYELVTSSPVPGVSQWGLIGMAALITGMIVWKIMRRRGHQAAEAF